MGAAPLSWLAKIGGDTLKTKAKLLSSAINELYDDGFKKKDIVGSDYIKAATADDLKNKVPEANAVKELNSNLQKCHINSDINLEMLYFRWSGNVAAGQTVSLGSFGHLIPTGKSFVCMFMTPLATLHISLSYFGDNVYAYSENYSGTFEYDVLMVVA